jgi:hypothetical protein
MPNYSDDFYDRLSAKGLEVVPETDDSGNFMRGVKGSFVQAGNMLKTAYGAATNQEGHVIGGVLDSQVDAVKYGGDTENFTDIDGVSSAADWMSFQAGNAVGSLAQMAVGGGVGSAIAKSAAKKLARDAATKQAVSRIGMQAGMFAPTYPQQYGETTNKIYQETGEVDFGIAPITAALGAGLDMLPVIRELDKFGLAGKARQSITSSVLNSPSKLKQISKSLGGTMLTEGSTEAAQDALGLVALEWVNENRDHFSVKELKGLLNSFMSGAAGGVALGAPAAVTQAWFGDKPVDNQPQEVAPEEYQTVEEPINVDHQQTVQPSINDQLVQSSDDPELDQIKINEYLQNPERFSNFSTEAIAPIHNGAIQTLQNKITEASQQQDYSAVKTQIDQLDALQASKPSPVTEPQEIPQTQELFPDENQNAQNQPYTPPNDALDLSNSNPSLGVSSPDQESIIYSDNSDADNFDRVDYLKFQHDQREQQRPATGVLDRETGELLEKPKPNTEIEDKYLESIRNSRPDDINNPPKNNQIQTDEQNASYPSFDTDQDLTIEDETGRPINLASKTDIESRVETLKSILKGDKNKGVFNTHTNLTQNQSSLDAIKETGGFLKALDKNHNKPKKREEVAYKGIAADIDERDRNRAIVDQAMFKMGRTPTADEASDILDNYEKSTRLEQENKSVTIDVTPSKKEIDQAANESAESPLNSLPTPSDAQKEAGNYKLGKIKNLHGLDISIENPKGSTRSGTNREGKQWSNKIKSHYGYIKGTVGADKDHLDIFLGDHASDESKDVYVVDQIDPDKNTFDEHKIMLGYQDEAHAKKSYLENYDKNWQGIGAINKLSMDEFKSWVSSGKTKKPLGWKVKPKTKKVLKTVYTRLKEDKQDVPSANKYLERDSAAKRNENAGVQTPVSGHRRGRAKLRDRQNDKSNKQSTSGASGTKDRSIAKGKQGNNSVDSNPSSRATTTSKADASRSAERERGDDAGTAGESSVERAGSNEPRSSVSKPSEPLVKKDDSKGASAGLSLKEKVKLQKKAESIPHKNNDIKNIRDTLPVLMKEQQEDVKFAEERFSKPDAYGVLFTNGTGTGKTFTGLGIAKRFHRQGKDNILIVAPSDKVGRDWVSSAKYLGMDFKQLDGIKDNGGNGGVVTTYANFYQNSSLAKREWDLIITDESHKLGQNKAGNETHAESMLRAISNQPKRYYHKAYLLTKDAYDALRNRIIKAITAKNKNADIGDALDNTALLKKLDPLDQKKHKIYSKQLERLTAKTNKIKEKFKNNPPPQSNVVFLSATPFAYQKSLRYADGYLFDSGAHEDKSRVGAYNHAQGFDSLLSAKFGYQMKTGKLNQPSADIDNALNERNFNQELKDSGVLRGRRLKVESDYSREFVLIDGGIGKKIDEGIKYLFDNREKYPGLSSQLNKRFDYLARLQTLESIKASAALDRIKQHHALGRKVIVFHGFKKNNTVHPFKFTPSESQAVYPSTIEQFKKDRPDLYNLDMGTEGGGVVDVIKRSYPQAGIFNGDIDKRTRNENVKAFNDDSNPMDVIVLQRDAGKEGVSLHDTTGKHQRALLDLGLPIKPTDAIQTEGRGYRTGVKSNFVVEYFTTGLDYETHAFATAVASRSSTAENLALGNEGRNLLKAFVDAYESADSGKPSLEQGVGGKAKDFLIEEASLFDQAKNIYHSKNATRGKRDQREGKDFYATPEPIGMKMVEWAGLKVGDNALEPSAGDGAIARWMPNSGKHVFVEPSYSLSGKLGMLGNGEVKNQPFEKLKTINKFDAVVMNPPYGSGGKTAIEHLDKAFKHLRDGGRVIALIPEGGMATKRFDKWYAEIKDGYMVADIGLPQVTFKKAGTAVKTRVVIIDKIPKKWMDDGVEPLAPRVLSLNYADDIKALFDGIEGIGIADRLTKPDFEKLKEIANDKAAGELMDIMKDCR